MLFEDKKSGMPDRSSDMPQFYIFHFFRFPVHASAAIPAAPKTAMPIQRPMGEESPVLGKFQAFFGPYSGVTVGCHGDGVSVGAVDCVGDGVPVGSVLCVGDGVSVGAVDCVGDGVSVGSVLCVGDGVPVGSVLCVGDGVSVGSAVDALSVKGISMMLSSLKYTYSVCGPRARVSR